MRRAGGVVWRRGMEKSGGARNAPRFSPYAAPSLLSLSPCGPPLSPSSRFRGRRLHCRSGGALPQWGALLQWGAHCRSGAHCCSGGALPQWGALLQWGAHCRSGAHCGSGGRTACSGCRVAYAACSAAAVAAARALGTLPARGGTGVGKGAVPSVLDRLRRPRRRESRATRPGNRDGAVPSVLGRLAPSWGCVRGGDGGDARRPIGVGRRESASVGVNRRRSAWIGVGRRRSAQCSDEQCRRCGGADVRAGGARGARWRQGGLAAS
jgi:hypothetical protein